MLALRGVYQNGQIHLDQVVNCNKPVAVIVTFLEEDEQVLQQCSIPSKINSLQTAFDELRTLCAEENYEWKIPARQNRLVEY